MAHAPGAETQEVAEVVGEVHDGAVGNKFAREPVGGKFLDIAVPGDMFEEGEKAAVAHDAVHDTARGDHGDASPHEHAPEQLAPPKLAVAAKWKLDQGVAWGWDVGFPLSLEVEHQPLSEV
ncbi:hypothetical protein ABW19_dt0200778 [Dactylella cylindrospora]|nr:hypothetical protein ABW19_dt0200778 [Dactylella cylindrospora]